MAASHQQTVGVAAPPPAAEAAVYQAFVSAGLTGVSGGGGIMRGTVPLGWLSWGENVTATVGFGPAGSVVTVRSECAAPTQLVDWGKNRKNVERVLDVLRAIARVV